MTEFKIETDIPIPSDTRTRTYPFAEMKVGDSFHFPESKLRAIRAAMTNHAKRNGGKFTARRIGSEMWRCWRVE